MLGVLSIHDVRGVAGAKALRLVSEVALPIAGGNLAEAERSLGGHGEVARIARESEAGSGSRDEVQHLRGAFARMLIALRETSATLQESAILLTNSVNHLSASASEQSGTISRQASALQQTEVTAEEIRQISLTTARKAQEVLEVAERANDISSSGEASVQQSIDGFSAMRDQVYEIARHISQLADRSREIGQITETVKDFADQSNMLAVNAAIEAVRSGEHGRGFSVVAREIRNLADQSVRATDRVRELLQQIVDETRKTVRISEEGAQQIDGGLEQVKASGQNIRDLAEIVKSNSGAVRQIAAAVGQQSAGVTQLFDAVKDLSSMMSGTIRQLETTNQAVEVVKDVSQRVAEVAERYRV